MRNQGLHAIINLPVKGSYPLYQWVNAAGEVAYEFNIWQGRGYHNGLAETELPTQLKSHLNSAQINPPETVSINVEGDYVTFDEEEHAVEIFNVGGDRFELWKEWTIGDQKTKYERIPEPKGIPESLQDEKLHWWQSIDPKSRYQAIVVQNNVPIFGVSEDRMFVLAEQGQQELLPANNLPSALQGIISRFENENYCLVYKSADKISMNLKRFGLTFEARSEAPVWILPQTGEWIDHTQAMPIDSRVKGLVLKPKDDKKKEEGRILVPVALFYAQNDDLTDNNDGYPVVHDNNQVIAKANIKDYCKKNAMLVNSRWSCEGSERYVSFTLKNGKPVAATVEDSLYLAYLYLTTDHPEKAWEILSTCTNLSGSFAELQYIRWICAELPHVLPSNETDYTRNRPTRDTPPVVACQLKVLSLLSQSLAFGGSFPLSNKQENVKNANDLYEQIEKENCSKFLQNLPDTLTKKYSRYLKMERSLEGLYQRDHKDKQHVQEAAKVKHGTMGAHWLRP